MTNRQRLVAVTAVVLAMPGAGLRGQQQNAVAALVAKAVGYVQDYEQRLSAVVCEERQDQRVIKADGAVRQQRRLVSDILFVRAGTDTLTFRDVISVDGKPVRNREERLQKIFLGRDRDLIGQAKALSDESLRYNIGFPRNLEGLMLPFAILDPHTVSGFTFTAAGTGLDFDEVRAPSLFGFVDTKGRHDMFLHGHFTIDAGSGRLLDARMTAENARFGTTVDVRYVENASLDLLVPVEMHERYTVTGKPNQDRLEVSATYSSFRTFQVTVSEQIGTPR